MAQQMKSLILNATRVLVVQQQIFINKIHVWQVESLVIIPYYTVYYLLYQEFLIVCASPQGLAAFLIVSAIR